MQTSMSSPIRGAKRAYEAVSALASVMRDPDDTKQFFRLLEAVGSRAPDALKARFVASRPGARLLAERPEILERLHDQAWLATLPEGSLGRAYLDFMNRDGLSADFLVSASQPSASAAALDDEGDYIGRRLRDSHDLWHVVTGYRGDLLGEAAILTFTFAQTHNFGIGIVVAVAALKADEPDARRLLLDAFARGLRSAWLVAVPWEELLAENLEAVRLRLRVGPPAVYEPFFARDLPPGGLFGHGSVRNKAAA